MMRKKCWSFIIGVCALFWGVLFYVFDNSVLSTIAFGTSITVIILEIYDLLECILRKKDL